MQDNKNLQRETEMDQAGRYEIKFVLSFREMDKIRHSISKLLEPDSNNEENGYRVLSLYYDSPDLVWFWDKVEGERIRTKMRLRIYPKNGLENVQSGYVELKLKTGHLVHKKRIHLEIEQAIGLCRGNQADTVRDSDKLFCEEIEALVSTLSLRPTAITSYRRIAYTSGETHQRLRVTFDSLCKGRVNDLGILSNASSFSFLPEDMGIMELKTGSSIPVWLLEMLQSNRVRINRMSKYCTAVAVGRGLKVLPLVSVPADRCSTGEHNHG